VVDRDTPGFLGVHGFANDSQAPDQSFVRGAPFWLWVPIRPDEPVVEGIRRAGTRSGWVYTRHGEEAAAHREQHPPQQDNGNKEASASPIQEERRESSASDGELVADATSVKKEMEQKQ
jgi:hypothetical protein